MIFLLFLSFIFAQQHIFGPSPPFPFFDKILSNHLHKLQNEIQKTQAKENIAYTPEFTYPPLKWHRQKGIYDSFVHLNFHGDLKSTLLRNGYHFPDDNAFVTIFIVEALIESKIYFRDLNLDKQELLDALDAIGQHRDQNKEGPVYSFWNQIELQSGNETVYKASPLNIAIPLGKLETGLNLIRKGLEAIHLDKFANYAQIAFDIESILSGSFKIPGDADDTGCNLALGWLLKQNQVLLFSEWAKYNQKANTLFETFLKFSYQPFSDIYPDNAIDPRTYVWIRSFLHQERQKQKPLHLLTTWIQSTSDLPKEVEYRKMPFNVNNIDASVTANALYGLLSLITGRLDGPLPEDEKYQEMILDNIRLLTFTINNELVEKYPMFTLLYYPSPFAFYWFVARLARRFTHLPRNLPKSWQETLTSNDVQDFIQALKQKTTQMILARKKCQLVRQCFWDDFLGNADHFRSHNFQLHEDRVFSTAMSLNALLGIFIFIIKDIWTERNKNQLNFRKETPQSVLDAVDESASFLIFNSWFYPKENAFFSGSVKAQLTNPYYFPHNSFKWLNGTSAGVCSQYKTPGDLGQGSFKPVFYIVASVSGYLTEEEYQQKLQNDTCFGEPVPQKLFGEGLNCEGCIFPYWSSPSMTNAMELLALSKYWGLKFNQ